MDFNSKRIAFRIRQVFKSNSNFAKAMGMSASRFCELFVLRSRWTSEEIDRAVKLLSIPLDKVDEYFFYRQRSKKLDRNRGDVIIKTVITQTELSERWGVTTKHIRNLERDGILSPLPISRGKYSLLEVLRIETGKDIEISKLLSRIEQLEQENKALRYELQRR